MDYDTFLDTPIDQITEEDYRKFSLTQFLYDSWNNIIESVIQEAESQGVDSSKILITPIDQWNYHFVLNGKPVAICTHVNDY